MRSARKAFVASLSNEERGRLEARLAEDLRPLIDNAPAVGGYHAVGSEIDPARALALAARHALPTFDAGAEHFAYRLGPANSEGPHAIPQPGPHAPLVDCSLVLVPLLAIDRSGHRLGQGGGHYDRVLPALRELGALLIGVGWDFQRLDFSLPNEPWDVALDGFASPSGLEMLR